MSRINIKLIIFILINLVILSFNNLQGQNSESINSKDLKSSKNSKENIFVQVQTSAELFLPDMSGACGSTINIPIKVSTDSKIGIAQFVIEFNSSIISYQGAQAGADISGFQVSLENQNLPFNPTAPGTNKNVLIQISGGGQKTFTGSNKEVAVLEFEVIGSSGASPLVFDRGAVRTFLTTENLNDLSGSLLDFFDGSLTVSNGAEEAATLKLPETTGSSGETVNIPIIVSTDSSIGIAQFVIEYNSNIIDYQGAQAGADISGFQVSLENQNLPFNPTAPGTNKNVLIQISGGGQKTFTGSNKEVAILKFEVIGSSGASPLVFDRGAVRTFLTTENLDDLSGNLLEFINGSFTVVVESAVPISPSAPASQVIDSEFWVDIEVGSSSKPVTDLRVISFELNYTNTSIVDYLSYEVGPFLTGAQANVVSDDPNGKISASVYRLAGGNSGSGVVLRLKFKVLSSATQGQSICFSIGSVQANSSSGGEIALIPTGTSCTEISSILIWPGDADNNGQVSIFDINYIIAIHWEKTGPARPNASFDWSGQACSPWEPEGATYTDCNGNGIINIFDINPVIVNFGKTHGLFTTLSSSPENQIIEQSNQPNSILTDAPIFIEARDYDDSSQEFWIDIVVGSTDQPVTDLKVVSFELTYSNTQSIDYVDYQIGTFLTEAQATVISDETNGKISASVYRMSGGNSGNGVVLSLKFKASIGQNISFYFAGIMANSSDGSTITFTATGKSVVTRVSFLREEFPENFALAQNYPNPFNPETNIKYQIPERVHVKISVFNLRGQKIRTLINQEQPAGYHNIRWDGCDEQGKMVVSGIYLYQIRARDFVCTKKMAFMK